MALTVTEIQQLYTAYLGRPVDQEGVDYWTNPELDLSIADLRFNLANDNQPEYVELYGDKNRVELITAIYENMFGRTPEAEGLEYWTEGEGSSVPANELQQLFIQAASDADSAAFEANVQADIEEYEQVGVEGETYTLTDGRDGSGRDVLTGTDDNDTFNGLVGQNQEGAIANAFSTGDKLDGGAGRDKIEASMINDNEVDGLGNAVNPRPITENIEEVYVEALESVTLDATRMENVEEYWSDFSRGDMTFENISLQGDNLNITKDVTFGIRDTESGTDFTAEFDSQSLNRAPEQSSNSQLQVRIADVSTETPEAPLTNVSVTLGFELGGDEYVLENIVSTDGTYQGLVEAIEATLGDNGLGELDISLSTPYDQVTVAGNTVNLPFTAQEILITDPNGNEFGNVDFTQAAIESVEGGFLVAGNADPVDPSVTSNLIESNLVLDNAGRGSIAGDVVIGGGSNSQLGVERFNVTVDRDSAIRSLNTTQDKLQEISIDSTGANGDLYIGSTQEDLNLIEANGFAGGELELGVNNAGVTGSTVKNLDFLDAGNTSANVTFSGENDGGTVAVLNTGAGDDSITLDQTGESSPSEASQTRSTINAGDGDNTVTVTGENSSIITTGAGDDIINGNGVSVTVNAGAGNDTIYAENTGDTAVATLGAAGGVFATTSGTGTAGAADATDVLDGRQVRVTVAMPEDAASIPAASFTDGYEVTAQIEASNGSITTQRDLYEAAAKAINEDPMVNKLVTASVDSSGNLKVDYQVDGTTAAGDNLVQVEVLGDWADLNSSNQESIADAVRAEYSDSDITTADVGALYDSANTLNDFAATTTAGIDAITTGVNNVNAGTGDDVVVLSSNDTTTDTVVFDQGGFGNDSIVHFNDTAATGDVLDFSAWLDNVDSASESVESEVRIDGTLAGQNAIIENSVSIADFADIGGTTFADMTDSEVLTALNGSNFGAGVNSTDLVGDVAKSVLMVENDTNAGEYNVYEVAYNTTDGEFTQASLVGTTDFGDQLGTLDAANIA